MDPINSVSQISRLLRQKLAENKIDGGHGSGRRAATGAGYYQRAAKLSAAEVRQQIRQRLQKLEPSERDGHQAALIFVESILAWEFGDSMLEDPRFAELSREVQRSITESGEHWAKFRKMLQAI